jgi:hypothetical protein
MTWVARFSTGVFLTGILCFAPHVFGQSTLHSAGVVPGYGVVNYTSASFLAFAFGPHADRATRNDHDGGGNGCGNQGGGGGNGWGWERRSAWDDGGNGGCTSVPEGGTTLMFLSIAGLCCLGALIFRSRRQDGVSEATLQG